MSKKSEYKQRNLEFLKQKAAESGVQQLPKGILYEVLGEGDASGKNPTPRSIVCVHYSGSLINGRVFDETDHTQCPAVFRLYEVIDGWQIALSRMRPGDPLAHLHSFRHGLRLAHHRRHPRQLHPHFRRRAAVYCLNTHWHNFKPTP